MLSRIFLLTLGALVLAVPAQAQIYAWRDANGTLVLSDRKTNPEAKTYAIAGATGFRSTRPVVSSKYRDQYEPMIQNHAARYSLAPELVRAVIQVESGFNSRARSPKGAMGLMQLMPRTARDLGVVNAWDPDENIRGGAFYLRQLLDKYEGNEQLALAAYNAGPAAVDKYGQTVPPYRETREYVTRVGSAAEREGRAPSSRVRKQVVYKTIEIVDGVPVARYSSEKPQSGAYEVIGR